MALPNSVGQDPDTSDQGQGGLSQATQVTGTPDATRTRANNTQSQLDALDSQTAAHQQMAAEGYSAQRAALQKATARLEAMDFGPSPQEQAYNVAAAAGTGDSAGHFNPAGISAAHVQNLQAQRGANLQREQMLQSMYEQLPQAQVGQANALLGQDMAMRRTLTTQNDQAQAQANKATQTAPKATPYGYVWNPATQAYEDHPEMRAAAAQMAQQKAALTAATRLAMQAKQWNDVDPQTKDFLAQQYLIDPKGVTAGLGRGGPGVILGLTQHAQQMAAAKGDDAGSIIAKRDTVAAAQNSLKDIVKRQSVSNSQEATAIDTMDNMLTQAKNVNTTASPLLNQALRHYQLGVTDDPATKGLVESILAAKTEYMKQISGATGAQGITDEARREGNDVFNKFDSYPALESAVIRAKQNMAFRKQSWADQSTSLQGLIRNGGTTPPPPQQPQIVQPQAAQSPPPGWTLHTDAQGRKAYVSPDGKQFQRVP